MSNAQQIIHQGKRHWVVDAGKRGFEIHRLEGTHGVRCASIGHGPGPDLGIEGAIAECNRRDA